MDMQQIAIVTRETPWFVWVLPGVIVPVLLALIPLWLRRRR